MADTIKTVYEGPIAGVSYGHFKFRPDRIEGRDLIVVAKPDNEYDARAIAVMAIQGSAALHVGYIPRKRTGPLHEVLEAGGRLKCTGIGMRQIGVQTRYGHEQTTQPCIRVTTTLKVKTPPVLRAAMCAPGAGRKILR